MIADNRVDRTQSGWFIGGVPAATARGTGPVGSEFKARQMVGKDTEERMAGDLLGKHPPKFALLKSDGAAGNLLLMKRAKSSTKWYLARHFAEIHRARRGDFAGWIC